MSSFSKQRFSSYRDIIIKCRAISKWVSAKVFGCDSRKATYANEDKSKKAGRRERKGDENLARYTATPLACGWAGAVFEVNCHLGRSSEAKDRKKKTKKSNV